MPYSKQRQTGGKREKDRNDGPRKGACGRSLHIPENTEDSGWCTVTSAWVRAPEETCASVPGPAGWPLGLDSCALASTSGGLFTSCATLDKVLTSLSCSGQ